MWLKILCVVVITSGALAADELLQTLYGVQGRNKVSVCVARASGPGADGAGEAGAGGAGGGGGGRWRRCPGALYTREWIIARAMCLAAAPSHLMSVVRLTAGDSCDELTTGSFSLNHRDVRTHVMHPFFDLAIVIVDHPYNNLDQLPNATTIRLKLRQHGVYKWMKYYFNAYALTRDHGYHLHRIASQMKTYKYPIWFFFMTMVLPSVLFMAFFIYVIFYTGSSREVPYNKLQYSKRVTQI